MLARPICRLLLATLALVALAAPAASRAADATGAQGAAPSDVYFYPSVYFPGLESVGGDAARILVKPDTLGLYIVQLYKFFTGATAIVALFMVTYGGLLWLLAGGNQGSISQAKETITGALAGMLIALLSYALLASISRGLVSFRSLDTRVTPAAGVAGSQGGEEAEQSRTFYTADSVPATVRARTYDAALAAAAARFDVNCTWLKATLVAESGGDPNAQSSAGACGLMQVTPATANSLLEHGTIDSPRTGPANILCEDLKDPSYGIHVGAAFMSQLWHSGNYPSDYGYCVRPVVHTTLKPQEDWSLQDKIAAYNGGPGANCKSHTCEGDTFWHCAANGGYAETRQYVDKVTSFYELLLSSNQAC